MPSAGYSCNVRTSRCSHPLKTLCILRGGTARCSPRTMARKQHCAATQVVQATDAGGNTVTLTAAMNFCGTQVYSTSGVLLPAASYGAVPETYVAGVLQAAASQADASAGGLR